MTHATDKMNDRLFRLIGIPVVALVSNVLFFYDNKRSHDSSFVTGYFHSVLHAWLLWEVARQTIIWTRRRFSSFAESNRRINYSLVLVAVTTAILMGGICAFYDLTLYWGYRFTFSGYVYNIFVALMYAVIIGGIYEGIYFFRKWREAFVEAEALKKANLQSQLDSLKGQINPHFLFNSLSSLSSLIAEDSKRAEKFVDELASVYRYLLQTNEKDLTEVGKELEFITAYFHLLKTRFTGGIELEITIEEKYLNCLIPPLTLQILIENAVKHNVILPERPLTIKVKTDKEDALVVENNLQKKNARAISNKMGLENIATKYILLKQRKIIIRESEDRFAVTIPLIKQKAHAHPYR